MDMSIEKTISQEIIFTGKIITVRKDTVELPNEKQATREVVEHTGAVAVVALTPQDELILVRQYRYALQKELFEIPAGKLDSIEEGPEACGRRELLEETGLMAQEMISLGRIYPSVGFSTEGIHLFLAQNLTQKEQCLDEDEFLTIHKVPLKEVLRRIYENEICDAKTIIGVLKAKEYLGK